MFLGLSCLSLGRFVCLHLNLTAVCAVTVLLVLPTSATPHCIREKCVPTALSFQLSSRLRSQTAGIEGNNQFSCFLLP